MNMVILDQLPPELVDVAERAERGRAFYFMFPGSNVSDSWLEDFEHVDTPAHGGDHAHGAADSTPTSAGQKAS